MTTKHECDASATVCGSDQRHAIFAEIDAERVRQDAKWGEQDHPMVGSLESLRRDYKIPDRVHFYPETYAVFECARHGLMCERDAKRMCAEAFREGRGTYTHIAVEELSEFVAACVIHGEASDKARAELVQVVAVGVAMLESIDRKRAVEKAGA